VILAALDQNRVTKKCNQNEFKERYLTGDHGDELYAGYYNAYFTALYKIIKMSVVRSLIYIQYRKFSLQS
jgi:hypothetical protein